MSFRFRLQLPRLILAIVLIVIGSILNRYTFQLAIDLVRDKLHLHRPAGRRAGFLCRGDHRDRDDVRK